MKIGNEKIELVILWTFFLGEIKISCPIHWALTVVPFYLDISILDVADH
jgi:hypothetical protein